MKEIEEIINYIEKDAEIAIPIKEFFDADGNHITKKQYGKVLLKYLVIELKERFVQPTHQRQKAQNRRL